MKLYRSIIVENQSKPCISCALQTRKIECIVIASTNHFEAQQDYVVPIPGFVIIASKRHVQSLDEFTADERKDFIEFVYKMRNGMRTVLNINTVYMIQEEDSAHFHLWLFPWYEWMHTFGQNITSLKSIMKWAQENLNTHENSQIVKETAQKLKNYYLESQAF
jgi:diadenosine tetraphosphate (Ap4A) HIT family hydrolase